MSEAPDLLSHSSDSFFICPKGSFNLQCLSYPVLWWPKFPNNIYLKPSSPSLPGTIIHAYCLSLAASHNKTDKPADSFPVSLVFLCFLSIYFTFHTQVFPVQQIKWNRWDAHSLIISFTYSRNLFSPQVILRFGSSQKLPAPLIHSGGCKDEHTLRQSLQIKIVSKLTQRNSKKGTYY